MKLSTMFSIILALSFSIAGIKCASSKPETNWMLNFTPVKDMANPPLIILDGKVFSGDINTISPSSVATIQLLHKESLECGVLLITSKEIGD